jgi:hypothetical protein
MMNSTNGNQQLSSQEFTCEVLIQLGHLVL